MPQFEATDSELINHSQDVPEYTVRWSENFTKIKVQGNGENMLRFEYDVKDVDQDCLIVDHVAQLLWKEHGVRGKFEVILK